MLEQLKNDVKELFAKDNSGHGFDHIMRVYDTAIEIAKKENANKEVVGLAVLLHDVDDYKLFGQECADNLTNTKSLFNKYNVSKDVQDDVLDIVANMGYSKSLQGIRPKSLEGKIVSDADMLDAIGALGLVRTISYATSKGNEVFCKDVFPRIGLSADTYKSKDKKHDNSINHFFEKLLKIQGLLFTTSAIEISNSRQDFMIAFLRQFFNEQGLSDWNEYLDNFLTDFNKAA